MPKVNSEVLRDAKPESGGGQIDPSGQKTRKLKVNIPKRLRMAPPIDEYNQTTITYLSTTRRSNELSFGDKMLCFAKSGSGVGILATVGFFLVIAVIIAALFVCRKFQRERRLRRQERFYWGAASEKRQINIKHNV